MNEQLQMMAQSQILQNHQNYVVWPPYPPENPALFSRLPAFNVPPPPPSLPPSNPSGRVIWKGNKPEKRKDFQQSTTNRSGCKGRRFHHQKRKFFSGGGGGGGGCGRLVAPFAPRNTTSFIIRAKKSGGIASLVSPCPVTPAILPTPMLSPSREVVVDMAEEKWGVDSYGSMKGLIRLRSGKENSDEDSEEIDAGGNECVEVEKRLIHDLSRFEMIYPNFGDDQTLENRVDEQDTQIAHLEVENLTLKEKIFLMERELGELRRRVICLETDAIGSREPEVVQGDITGDVCSEKSVGNGGFGGRDDNNGNNV